MIDHEAQSRAALGEAIGRVAAEMPADRLARALADLTARYRGDRRPAESAMTDAAERLAYLVARMPATHAAALYVCAELARRAPGFAPRTLLDLGAGAGAATAGFPGIRAVTLIERDAGMIALGRRLAAAAGHPVLAAATWRTGDLAAAAALPQADLVVLSYALGELPEAAAEAVPARAWAAARQALVLVEPGSRRGFATVREARTRLLAAGASLAAPCPHHDACPLADPDWCHFPVRFERAALHRTIVGGTLPYDDEKFSYLAVIRDPALARPAAGRVVRAPLRRSGHVVLDLCAGGALVRHTLSKRHGAAYRAARRAGWGDAWPSDEKEEEENASGGQGPGGPWIPIP